MPLQLGAPSAPKFTAQNSGGVSAPNIADLGSAIRDNLPAIGGVAGGAIGSLADEILGPFGTAGGSAAGGTLGTILQNILGGKSALANPSNIAKNAVTNGLFGLIPGVGEAGAALGDRGLAKVVGAAVPSGALAGAAQGVQNMGTGISPQQNANSILVSALTGGTINGVATPLLDSARNFIGKTLPDKLENEFVTQPDKLTAEAIAKAHTQYGSIASNSEKYPQEEADILGHAISNGYIDPNAPITESSPTDAMTNIMVDMAPGGKLSNKFDNLWVGKKVDLAGTPTQLMQQQAPIQQIMSQFNDLNDVELQRRLEPYLPTQQQFDQLGQSISSAAANGRRTVATDAELHSYPAENLRSMTKILYNNISQNDQADKLLLTLNNQLKSPDVLSKAEMEQYDALNKEYHYDQSLLSNFAQMRSSDKLIKLTDQGATDMATQAVQQARQGKMEALQNLIKIYSLPPMIGAYAVGGFKATIMSRILESGLLSQVNPQTFQKVGTDVLGTLRNPTAQAVGTALGGPSGALQQILARLGQQNPNNQNNQGQQ